MTVVVPEDNGAEATAFAAGVAAATAAQAEETAVEAEQTAEAAAETAISAVDVAASAQDTAWDARAAVDELDARMGQALAGLPDLVRSAVAEAVAPPAEPEPTVPAPEAKGPAEGAGEAEGAGKAESDSAGSGKAAGRDGYGSGWWFGKR